MTKDFDTWNIKKKEINEKRSSKFYHPRDICLVVPLTTSEKKHAYRLSIGVVDNKQATAMLSQIRVVDTKRFVGKIAVLNKELFGEIQKHIRDFF